MRSKSYILALLHSIQEASGNQVFAVIRAVITRWTAHYLAYQRLLQLRYSLQTLVNIPAHLEQIRTLGDTRARQKSDLMITLIFNDQFWNNLTVSVALYFIILKLLIHLSNRMVHHLRPLAISANILQSAHCRLDQVLIVLAALYYEYSQLPGQENALVKNALLSSINRRWEKADQIIYIAAVSFNPLIKMQLFASIPQLTFNGIYQILASLWTRFTRKDPPLDLLSQIKDYFSDKGIFAMFTSIARNSQQQANSQVLTFFL